jgi:hypothetical protein
MNFDEAKKVYPPIWVIYDHPTDYPRWFVVRVWYGEFPGEMCQRATLDMARKAAWCMGAQTKMPRSECDDAKIVESWI